MSGTPQRPRVLVIDADSDRLALLGQALRTHYAHTADHAGGESAESSATDIGEIVTGVSSARDALAMDLSSFDIIVQHDRLPDMDALELLDGLVARVTRPVMVVSDNNDSRSALEALRRGAQDYVVGASDSPAGLGLLIDKNLRQYEVRQDNQRLQEQLTAMLQELETKNAQLLSMAQTDPLTNLANRRRFTDLLDRCFNEASRYGFDLACCMCDLDDFKKFNDALGHPRGDELLQMTGELIASGLRSTDVAARYGGDEFVILLPHTSADRAVAVCQRIRGRLARAGRKFAFSPLSINGPRVAMSVGIASLQTDGPKTAAELVAMADRALYRAKAAGKNCVVTLTPLRDGQQSA